MTSLEIGDFIHVPSWKTYGMVVDLIPESELREWAMDVYLQESPDSPKTTIYRLLPSEFEIDY